MKQFELQKQGRSNVLTYPQTGETIRVYKCPEPVMGTKGGHSWDYLMVALINGQETRIWCDTTWGKYTYFAVKQDDGKKQWYKYDFWQTPKPFNPF